MNNNTGTSGYFNANSSVQMQSTSHICTHYNYNIYTKHDTLRHIER